MRKFVDEYTRFVEFARMHKQISPWFLVSGFFSCNEDRDRALKLLDMSSL
jgi:hypothetical protein